MRPLVFALIAAMALLVAACSGSTQIYSTPATSAPQSTVSFLVIVPTTQTSTRKPSVTVPSNSQSVTITLNSVNGASYTGTSTTANLSNSNSSCVATSAQLSCVVNVTVPAGTLVFTLSAYSGTGGTGTLLATGNISVTATAGQTVSAPATIGGTLAKIVITISSAAELGVQASVPVTIQGEDANGDTILGTYSSPITLTDTDASGQTSLSATNVPDSTTAAGVTLSYKGGAMSAAALVGASASGVSASSVTTASFSPDQTNPTVNDNAVTFSYTYQDGYAYASAPQPSPTPGPTYGSYSYSYGYTTGSFNGVSNAISINGDYYAWTPVGSTSVLGYLGYVDGDGQEVCSSPYQADFVIPVPSSWSVYSGSGPCVYTYNYYDGPTYFETESTTYNADGSYAYDESWNYTSCCSGDLGSETYTLTSQGNASYVDSEGGGSTAVTVSAPASSTSSTLNASYVTYPSGTFPPSGTPAPTATTMPNPWLSFGVSLTPPVQSDVYTSKGTIASLPSGCNVSASILGSSPTLTEIDETQAYADPIEFDSLYYSETVQHYYLAGVGQVCFNLSSNEFYYDEGLYNWVTGDDQYWVECTFYETDSLTNTSLTAAIEKRKATTNGVPYAAVLDAAAKARVHQLRRQQVAKARARLAKKGIRGPSARHS